MSTARSLKQTDSAVEGLDRAAVQARREGIPPLSAADRARIVDEIARMVEGLYVHLPLKRAMYGTDAVQQLRRLRDRAVDERMDDDAFHAEFAAIIAGLRDAHTVYVGPASLEGLVARLPFLVEQYGADAAPRFVVSKVIADLVDEPSFAPGVEILHWNGVPIADAVRQHAASERGGRPDSALARGVDTLTFRPIGYLPMPPEHWVIIGYREAEDAPERELRTTWRFVEPGAGPEQARPTEASAIAIALHPDRSLVRRAKKLSFNRELWRTEDADRAGASVPRSATEKWMSGKFQDSVSARKVVVDGVAYGYLRLWSFDLVDDDGYLNEVRDLLAALPQNGLIVDVRGNPGGLIMAAERMLQFFTPRHIEPTRFSLIATDVTRDMSDAAQNRRLLGPWRQSLADAQATGELYSQGVPITPPELCNDVGQVYGGPVVAIVDATTYSAGDLFAAGFADNGVGTVVSVGRATGGGGANVWRSDVLRAVLAGSHHPLAALPDGIGFTMAVRRATRVGASAGAPIEDVGIVGNRTHEMTRDDLLHDNVDLIRLCARLIDAAPTTAMTIAGEASGLSVDTTGINRLDWYVDSRPAGSAPTAGHLVIPVPGDPAEIRVEGFRGDVLVQLRRVPEPADLVSS